MRIDATDVSKMVRRQLKIDFPSITFRVTTKKYSGGSSIRVNWTDGPTTKQVEKIVGKYHGADFDAMVDLKEYNGRPFGNDYIFCDRTISYDLLQKAAHIVAKRYGVQPATITRTESGSAYIERGTVASSHSPNNGPLDVATLTYQEAREVAA